MQSIYTNTFKTTKNKVFFVSWAVFCASVFLINFQKQLFQLPNEFNLSEYAQCVSGNKKNIISLFVFQLRLQLHFASVIIKAMNCRLVCRLYCDVRFQWIHSRLSTHNVCAIHVFVCVICMLYIRCASAKLILCAGLYKGIIANIHNIFFSKTFMPVQLV